MLKLVGWVVALAFLSFLAPPPIVLAGAQQEKMKACNEEAGKKELKGDERKTFMSSCLSAKPVKEGSKGTAQQEKMKSCNKEAGEKGLKGDERKKFMSTCLSAK